MAKVLQKLSKKFCVETAVYWGNPQNDGFGTYEFDSPVEIKCRWEDVSANDLDRIVDYGETFISKSKIMLLQDVDLHGYLYKGTLSSLSGQDTTKPSSIINAHIILRFDKIPMVMKTDDFFRVCYVYEQGK